MEDREGYYYRAPRPLMQHSFAGFTPCDGGIFLGKGDRTKVRGYIVRAGERTKFGNLARAHYILRD